MIDFMRLSLALDSIDDPLHDEVMFAPVMSRECVPESLRAFGFPATGSDDFLDGYASFRASER
jgi:hypothetical protein